MLRHRPQSSVALALLLLSLACAASVRAQTFVPGTQLDVKTSNTTDAVLAADVNGDAKPDLLILSAAAANVAVVVGNGRGGLAAPVTYPVAAGSTMLAVGDVNGEGRADIAACSPTSNRISVYLGQSNGTFAVRVDLVTGTAPRNLLLVDLNGDQRDDVVLIDHASTTVSAFVRDPGGAFLPEQDLHTGPVTAVAAGDLDSDGRLDLLVVRTDGLLPLIGDGRGVFTASTLQPVTGLVGPAYLAEFDANATLDLALVDGVTGAIAVFFNGGAGTFSGRLDPSTFGLPNALIVADYDGDSRADLLTGTPGTGVIQARSGDGIGGFGSPVVSIFLPESSLRGLAVADFNLDGRPEVAFGLQDGASVVINRTNGQFDSPRAVATLSGPRAIEAVDINSDGKLDLVTANQLASSLSVFLGDGAGNFPARTDYAAGDSPMSVATGDFNKDSRPDVIVANTRANTLTRYLTSVGGALTSPITIPTANHPMFIATGDLNGDSNLDLAVPCNLEQRTSVYLGDGLGGFGARTDWPGGVAPRRALIRDLNGDGKRDLLLADSTATLTLLPGNGLGGFGAAVLLDAGANAVALAVGDLNGDGRQDIVSANDGGSGGAVFLANGSGGFNPRVDVFFGTAPQSVAIGDVNGDDRMDIVTANPSGPQVRVLLGNGSGNFLGFNSSAQTMTALNTPQSVGLADLTGDGRLDVYVANFGSTSFSVWPGRVQTTVALAVSPTPAPTGFNTTFTATLASVGSVLAPAGVVWFFDGYHPLGAVNPSVGVAKLTVTNATLGRRTVRAIYFPNGSFTGASDWRLHRVERPEPAIVRVQDVPNDQGGHVLLTWRNYLDQSPYTTITGYRIWRRAPVLSAWRTGREPGASGSRATPELVELLDGFWESVASLPAERLLQYAYTANTVLDSLPGTPNATAYFVTALTADPNVFYQSAPDSGSSKDNLAPAPPALVTGQYEAGITRLHWARNSESDLSGYRLYRGSNVSFTPGEANRIADVSDTGFVDAAGAPYVYKLTAVDAHGNASPPSLFVAPGLLGVEDRVAGDASFSLVRLEPNPVHSGHVSATVSLPRPESATLEVLDAAGRQVARQTLVGRGGQQSLEIELPRALAPGLYFVRLQAVPGSRTRRLVVLGN